MKSATNGLLREMKWATRKLPVVNGSNGSGTEAPPENVQDPGQEPFVAFGNVPLCRHWFLENLGEAKLFSTD